MPKTQPLAWVVRAASTQASLPRAQWKLTSDGRIFNRESAAYVNIIKDAGMAVRGHGNAPNKKEAAGPREFSTRYVRIAVVSSLLLKPAKVFYLRHLGRALVKNEYVAPDGRRKLKLPRSHAPQPGGCTSGSE